MSYMGEMDLTGVYSSANAPQISNTQPDVIPDYTTLGNYYAQKSTVVSPVYVTPQWGGVGYSILEHNVPQTKLDGNYFNLCSAYPTACCSSGKCNCN